MRPRILCLVFATVLAATSLLAQPSNSGPVPPPPPGAGGEELVNEIKLPDADIDTVLGLLELYTGRSILRPAQLPTATYHLVINRKLPKSEAVLALETILSLNQIGVAPLGDKFLKVVALAQVKTEAPEMIMGSTLDLPASGRIATKLFQFEFLRVTEFIPQLTPLMSPGVANGIVPLEKANAALITDTVSNLQRVEILLQKLDKPSMSGLEPKFYQLRNGAKASDIVGKIRAMFTGPLQSQLGTAVSYSADDRTNQIVVLADPRQIALFDELIAKLDIKSDPNTRNEVIYLKHASAKDLAPLLTTLISGQTAAAQKSGSTGTRPQQPQPVAPAPNTPATATVLPGETPGAVNEFSNLITVTSDDRSNSVVISGTVDDIRLIHELVDKLDVLLAQVSIQVVIAEVTLSDTDTTGLSALNLAIGQTSTGATQITNFDTMVAGSGGAASTPGLAGWGLTVSKVSPLALTAAMSNVGQKNNVQVLNANTIVTTHNKEAEFVVSEQQPIITNQVAAPGVATTGTGTVTNPTSSFDTSSSVTYKDIGIDVKVTPLIGDDGSIQLKIDQKVDDVVGTAQIGTQAQPIIGHREATSFINVQDGEMVVLGGLQTAKVTHGRTKLGLFYEIPILSNLLGGHNNETDRTELLLFVRPHVLSQQGGTADAKKNIDALSSQAQVNQFLKDPSKLPKQSVIDKFVK